MESAGYVTPEIGQTLRSTAESYAQQQQGRTGAFAPSASDLAEQRRVEEAAQKQAQELLKSELRRKVVTLLHAGDKKGAELLAADDQQLLEFASRYQDRLAADAKEQREEQKSSERDAAAARWQEMALRVPQSVAGARQLHASAMDQGLLGHPVVKAILAQTDEWGDVENEFQTSQVDRYLASPQGADVAARQEQLRKTYPDLRAAPVDEKRAISTAADSAMAADMVQTTPPNTLERARGIEPALFRTSTDTSPVVARNRIPDNFSPTQKAYMQRQDQTYDEDEQEREIQEAVSKLASMRGGSVSRQSLEAEVRALTPAQRRALLNR
jgi:hypothetical protein